MSRIRSKHTSIEIKTRKIFREKGHKYKLHADLPGRPDIVFSKAKTALFVHGCFWHGHTCAEGHIPKTNSSFWKNKIYTNILRDKKNVSLLKQQGWKVFVLFECDIEKKLFIKTKPILKVLKNSK